MGTPSSATVCDTIDALTHSGDSPAVIQMAADGPIHHGRAELGGTVRRLCGGLVRAGVKPGDVVALLAENRVEWIASALAVIRSGASVLPIDTQTGDANLQHILEDSGARLVLTGTEQSGRLNALTLTRPPRLIRMDDEDEWRELLNETEALPASPGPDAFAVVFYTSGTTGPPKGVPLTHRNLVFQLHALQQVRLVTEQDRVLLPLPLHHVYPFVMGMLVPLHLRVPAVLPRALTGPEILRAIGECEVTAIAGVPRLYRAVESGIAAQIDRQNIFARTYLKTALAISTALRQYTGVLVGKRLLAPLHRRLGPSLRLLASGGSQLDAALARKLEGLGWEIGIGYGLTETSPLLTVNLPEHRKPGSVGRAVPGVELKIEPARIPDNDQSAPAQTGGEVLARGPNVFNGYRNAEDRIREAFTDDGWFRTGDLGYFDDDGFLYLQGRASTLIVTESGKNIQPEEIEERYALHPWIKEAGVLEREGRLAAVIIPDAEAVRRSNLGEQDAIKKAVADQSKTLPSYQRLGEYAISREALARTRLGKIQRHRLAERYRHARDEAHGRAAVQPGPIPLEDMSDEDRALIEQSAARKVWEWLAARYADTRLTPDTSPYMDLNIDSIEMINLTMEINRLTGVELDEESIAGLDTVRDLLHVVARGAEAGNGGLDPERILTEPGAYLSDEQSRWLKPLSPLPALLARLAHWFVRVIMWILFRLDVHGEDNLPRDRVFVLTPNHASVLDPLAVFAAVPFAVLRKTFFAGWTGMVFKNRLMRAIARIGQTVPIDPRHAAVSSLALGATVLKNGNNLVWFPEGERAWDGKLNPFKPGIGLLLKHYRVAVVPVSIEGAYEAMPRGTRLPRPRPIRITFGEPLDTAELAQADGSTEEAVQDRISRRLHDRVAQLKKTGE